MGQVGGMFVRIRLDKSSGELLEALAALMSSVEHADPALLEDSIAAAHARMKLALLGEPFRFEVDE